MPDPGAETVAPVGTSLPSGVGGKTAKGPLEAGAPFGVRYRILRELGAGGMGVVYQAWDDELGVAVALKVIRPEVTADPYAAREVERRFKRELLLARQVTHKNVVRIHDLGEVDGIKYITMPFIEGRDLSGVLREAGTLPVARVLRIARQVAAGLQAAHEAGVVHRDLKPENVMLAEDDHALIMDFGISRSVEQTGGTMTAHGAVVGTLEYMAPEQGRGQQVDQRADLYAFGLMLYDMLAGRGRIHAAESAIAELMSRMTQSPKPLRQVNPAVPEPVERIVARCLEPEPEKRYQNAAELLADLDQVDADGRLIVKAVPKPPRRVANFVMAAVTLVAILVAGFAWWRSGTLPGTPAAPREPVSILIADFNNNANDEAFDGLVEQALAIGVESASFVSVFPRRDALRAARQEFKAEKLDLPTAQLLSNREGIDYIIHGAIDREGAGFKLTVKTLPEFISQDASAADREAVLKAVGDLAKEVRVRLGDSGARSAGEGETFTAANIDAAAAYAKAQELNWAGDIQNAVAHYQRAISLDPMFGRAQAGLAALLYNTGRRDDSLKMYEAALQNRQRMTEREVLRTRGGYFLAMGDARQATETFEELVEKYPADTAGLANLAVAKLQARDMKSALEIGKRAADIFERNVIRRNNLALFAMYAGDFDAASQHATKALEINNTYPKAFVVIAMSHLAQGRPKEAEATWRKLEAIPAGRTLALAGLADLAMFRGLPADAISTLKTDQPDARQTVTLAEAQLMSGNTAAAATTASAAASRSKDPAVLFLAGQVLLQARRPEALQIAETLRKQLDRDARIDGGLLLAQSALMQGDFVRAQDAVDEAQKIADTWMGRFMLGRVNLAAGNLAGAERQFEICVQKRGEATALFLDDIPTYRVFPAVHYYLGLAREGQGNKKGAEESFRTFIELKDPASSDPLLADARKRLGA